MDNIKIDENFSKEEIEKLVQDFEKLAKEQLAIKNHQERDRIKLGKNLVQAMELAEEGGHAEFIGRLILANKPILEDHIFMMDWDPSKIRAKLKNLQKCLKRCKKNYPPGTKGRRWCNRMCFTYFVYCEL